jgi:hypothetical protein
MSIRCRDIARLAQMAPPSMLPFIPVMGLCILEILEAMNTRIRFLLLAGPLC